MDIMRRTTKSILRIASAVAQSVQWTTRSVASAIALVCMRIDSEFQEELEESGEEATATQIGLFLDEEGTRNSIRTIVAGLLMKDTVVLERFPPLLSHPDNHLIVSPEWISAQYLKFRTIFQEKLGDNKEVQDASITSTLWSLCGIMDAGAHRPLGKVKPPPKPRAVKKKVENEAADTAEVDNPDGNLQDTIDENAGETSNAGAASTSSSSSKPKSSRSKPSTSASKAPKKPKTQRKGKSTAREEAADNEDEMIASTSDLPSASIVVEKVPRRPTRIAALAATARNAEMAEDTRAHLAEMQREINASRRRSGAATTGASVPTVAELTSTHTPVSSHLTCLSTLYTAYVC